MRKIRFTLLFATLLFAVGAISARPLVELVTSKGNIRIELYSKRAPVSVKNFLRYARAKRYDGTIFHRVISNFMIQGGGFTPSMQKKPTYTPIKNEATNRIKNTKYTVAMARTGIVDSATNQFFINVKDNRFLNHKNTSAQGYGYAVFGKVVSGKAVVEKIKNVSTSVCARVYRDCPMTPVIIKKVKIIRSR